jgi:hypothetical protein
VKPTVKAGNEKNLCGTNPLQNGLKNEVCVRFEVCKLTVLRILVSWNVMLGSRLYRLQCLKGTLAMDPTTHEDEGATFLQNIGISKSYYTAKCRRRPESSRRCFLSLL